MAPITLIPTCLFDTTVFIDHLSGRNHSATQLILKGTRGIFTAAFSVITEAELWYGIRNQEDLKAHNRLLMSFHRLPVQRSIARRAGELRKQYENRTLHLADALIAATAEHYKIPVYTKNVKHFDFIDTITVRTYP